MDYDSKEESNSIADIEGDEDIDDSFSDDLLAGSDVKIHDISPKPAVAPSNKRSINLTLLQTIQLMKMMIMIVSLCPFSHIFFSS